ncbi:16024_t:CDS:2, partial [Cetraspora pellucida]
TQYYASSSEDIKNGTLPMRKTALRQITDKAQILVQLDTLVRPDVHKILVVIELLLINEDYFARC